MESPSSLLFFTKAKPAVATIKFLIAFCLVVIQGYADYCYFIPPPDWSLADPTKLSPRVKIGFLGKSSKGLLPSVNLATEEVDVSLKVYLDAVKKIHEADPNTRWRDLGSFKTSFGEGRLTEVETKIAYGIARRMQLIVIKDSTAYIMTLGALKEEFPKHYKTFETVLGSLRLTDDLTSAITSPQKKAQLTQLIQQVRDDFLNNSENSRTFQEIFQLPSFQKNSWEPFQKKIVTDFAEMGAYWQILMLQDMQKQLLQLP